MTDNLDDVLRTSVAAHQRGDLPDAIRGYRQVLAAYPEHGQTLYLLGTALLQSGEFSESADVLGRAADRESELPDVHNNLGIALQALGRRDEAEQSFRAAVDRSPDSAEAQFNLGRLLTSNNRDTEAEPHLRRAIERNPDDRDMQLALADLLCRLERWEPAVPHLRAAIALPGFSTSVEQDPAARLGTVLAQIEQYDEAAVVLRGAINQFPNAQQLHSNLSYVQERLGHYPEAEQSARAAIAAAADMPEAWNHLGLALRGQARLDEAIDAFSKALELRPDFPLAEFNLAATRMLSGDLTGGWPGYERRFDIGEAEVARFGEPRWDGSSLEGKTLLVVAEQGLGDAMQFSRLLPGLANQAGRVVFRCADRLHPLLQRLETDDGPQIELVAPGKTLPPIDCWTPLLSIPGQLGTSIDSVPQREKWLSAEPSLKDHWQTWLREQCDSETLTVGIAWQGAPEYRRDRERSIPLAEFALLAGVENVRLVSLQHGPGTEQIEPVAGMFDVLTPPEPFDQDTGAFMDTAALMECLDLVICSDSAVAHLAGSLGVPVWVALSHVPEWRWMLDRPDSPWYPAMRLYRQQRTGDWSGVFRQMADALQQRRESQRQ